MGAVIDLSPEQVALCLEESGIGFMFAPIHHPAMKVVAPIRKEMGVRTIFNILGPLTNPAGAPNILMGVFHEDLVGIQVRALQRLGASRALVVWGRDGMDEITLGASTLVGELCGDDVREYEIHPRDFGLALASSDSLRVGDAAQSRPARASKRSTTNTGPVRDIVLLNSGRGPVRCRAGRIDCRGHWAGALGCRLRARHGQNSKASSAQRIEMTGR